MFYKIRKDILIAVKNTICNFPLKDLKMADEISLKDLLQALDNLEVLAEAKAEEKEEEKEKEKEEKT